VFRKRVKSVVGGAFETGWEHTSQEEVIMRVDRYLVLVLSEEMNGINRSRVVLEVRHYELFEKTVR